MIAKMIQQDGLSAKFIADKSYEAGDVLLAEAKIFVVTDDTKQGDPCVVYGAGVYRMPKKKEVEIPLGARVQFLDTDKVIAPIAPTDNKAIPHAICWQTAHKGEEVVLVKLL